MSTPPAHVQVAVTTGVILAIAGCCVAFFMIYKRVQSSSDQKENIFHLTYKRWSSIAVTLFAAQVILTAVYCIMVLVEYDEDLENMMTQTEFVGFPIKWFADATFLSAKIIVIILCNGRLYHTFTQVPTLKVLVHNYMLIQCKIDLFDSVQNTNILSIHFPIHFPIHSLQLPLHRFPSDFIME